MSGVGGTGASFRASRYLSFRAFARSGGVDKDTTVVFPAPLMSTIGELGSFLARETAASRRRRAVVNPGQGVGVAETSSARGSVPVLFTRLSSTSGSEN